MATRVLKNVRERAIDSQGLLVAINRELVPVIREIRQRFNELIDEGTGGYSTVLDEGIALPAQAQINFIGQFVSATDDPGNGWTAITVSGVTVQDEGVALVPRSILNFVGTGVAAVDDGASKTTITIPAPNYGTDNQIPFMNAAGDGFSYSANLTFDDTVLRVGNSQAIAIGPATGTGRSAGKGDLRIAEDFEMVAWDNAASVNQGVIALDSRDIWIGRSNTEGVSRESVRGGINLYTSAGGSIIGVMGSTFNEKWRFQSTGGKWTGLALKSAETGSSRASSIFMCSMGSLGNGLFYWTSGGGLLTTLATDNAVAGTLRSWNHSVEGVLTSSTDGATADIAATIDTASSSQIDEVCQTEFSTKGLWMCEGTVVGYSTAGTADKGFSIKVAATFRSTTATLTQLGATEIITAFVSDAALAAVVVAFAISGTSIRLTCVGVAGITIKLCGRLDMKVFKGN